VPSPFKDIRKELSTAISQGEGQAEADGVLATTRGVTQEFKGGKIFAPGSSIVLPEAEPLLDRVAQLVTLLGNSNYRVKVEGRADDVPIATAQFPSNWELSAQRASAIVRFLISHGGEADRMIAIGMADTQPKVPHRDDAGNPIVENRDINRRIVIKIER
jgi:chemotaxis protein MotB